MDLQPPHDLILSQTPAPNRPAKGLLVDVQHRHVISAGLVEVLPRVVRVQAWQIKHIYGDDAMMVNMSGTFSVCTNISSARNMLVFEMSTVLFYNILSAEIVSCEV